MPSPSAPAAPAHASALPCNRKLRILHTEAATGLGGQEIYILRHMQAMRERGHEVSLLCQPQARMARLAQEQGFTVHTLRMGGLARLLIGIWRVARLARQHGYDVVNTTSRRDTLIAAAGARLARTPLIVRSRHLMSPINSLLTYTDLPHRVITVSHFVKQLLVQRGILARDIGVVPPIAVAPQWSDQLGEAPTQTLAQARSNVRTALGFSDDDVVVGCVAVLREAKGHVELLRAMMPLCRKNPRLHLVIVGDGEPVMGRLKEMRAEAGLLAQIHLLGYRSDACTLMPGFDLFALASYKEAAGTVFLEAAFAGVPIVATHVGGIPEMVAEDVNALLVQRGDGNALAAALDQLIRDGQRRRAMGAAGLEWLSSQERFTPSGHAGITEHHYYTWLKELQHGKGEVGTGADAPSREPLAGDDHGLA